MRQNLTEVFVYDNLYRLDYSTLNGATNRDFSYDALGNITYNSDVGTYTYHPTKKHAVATAGPYTISYDNNGNVLSDGAGGTATWYSYNLPNVISGPGSSGTGSSQMWYGPERNRWKQVATASGLTETTFYVGGILEKVTLLGVTSWKHYISGPLGPVAMYTRKSDGTQSTYYFTKDHLGSTDSITDASGTVQVRLSYHAFGKRRKEAGWSGSVTTSEWLAITNTTRRGFTFHEMLDSVGMIHMNGRIYSPTIGRFLSPDPFVPDPLDTQSFNRYSYVLNNPLSLVDPSGFATRNTANDPPDPEARHDAAILAMARAAIANGGQFPSIWDFSSGMAWAQSMALPSFRGASGPLQLEPTDFSGRQWRYVPGQGEQGVDKEGFPYVAVRGSGHWEEVPQGQSTFNRIAEFALPIDAFICFFDSGLPGSCSGGKSIGAGVGFAAAIVPGGRFVSAAGERLIVGAAERAAARSVARLVGQSGRAAFGETAFRGLVQNRALSELTDAEVRAAFAGTGFTVSNHAISRLLDSRTANLGIRTLNDLANVLNNGVIGEAGGGMISIISQDFGAIVDPVTKAIITFRPF